MNLIVTQFPIILVSIAYAIGILLTDYVSGISSKNYIFYGIALLLSIIALEKYLKRFDHFKTLLLLFLIITISFFINSIRINPIYKYQNYDEVSTYEVVVTKLFYSNDKYQNCIVENVDTSDKYLTHFKLKNSNQFKVGALLFVEGKIEKLDDLIIPNNFDFSNYLKRKNIYNRLSVQQFFKIGFRKYVSSTIEDKIDSSILSHTSKGLMKALVLGNKDGIPDNLLDSFSDSGIMHLLALSGLHLGILTIILTFLLKPLKFFHRGKLVRSIIVVILLWYYAYITGFSSSIIRATIMFSIIVIGHGMRREINIFNSLAIAALVLLLINPNYIFDVGFQLSFSAVIGIVWIFPMLNKLWIPKFKVVKYLWSLLVVSISAQVATVPLTIYYFHKFSGLFFIANIFEIPLITLLLGLSYLLIPILLLGVKADLLFYIYDRTVDVIGLVSSEISSFESVIFENLFISKLVVLILFMLIISAVLFIQTKRIRFVYFVLIAIVSLQINEIFKVKNILKEQTLMMAKDQILIHKGGSYTTNIDSLKLFYNYVQNNRLTNTKRDIKDVFYYGNLYYWKLTNKLDYNPITQNHIILIDNYQRSNPNKIINQNSVGVIYSGYKNSKNRTRWEYYCSRNNLVFYDTNMKLYKVSN